MKALHINGDDLTLEAAWEVAVERRAVLLDPDAREAVERARAVVDALVEHNQVSYAITTGVGKLSDVRIAGEQIRQLQVNLVRSHAVGVGEPLSIAETRAMMLLRANSLSKGYSGVRAAIIDTLCEMLNHGVTPMVPSQGSVGASGDLAYTVWIEHGEARLEGHEDYFPIVIRVTHIFRREEGTWKIVHRHGDPVIEKTEAAAIIQR